MDLAFHSRVVRKLFHNYKHQLHNIMKYQLTLQKELNLKYQQEKQMKQQIQKLEEDLRAAQKSAEEAPKKLPTLLNFQDDDEIRDKKIAEIKKQHEKMKNELKGDEEKDGKLMDDIRSFLNKDIKVEDSSKLREQLMALLTQLEKERDKFKDFDPNSEAYKLSLQKARNEGAAAGKKPTSDAFTMVVSS